MKKITVFLLMWMVVLPACKKDPVKNTQKICRKEANFYCLSNQSDLCFSGKINGIDFCVSDGTEEYKFNAGIGTVSITSTSEPIIGTNAKPFSSFLKISINPPIVDNWEGKVREHAPWVEIKTPFIKDTAAFDAKEYLDRFIKKGNLLLRDEDVDEFSGFYFEIGWNCYLEEEASRDSGILPNAASRLSTINSDHGKNTRFEVAELVIEEVGDFLIYNIIFEIECDLYWADNNVEETCFGRLEDGVFKTQIVVSK